MSSIYPEMRSTLDTGDRLEFADDKSTLSCIIRLRTGSYASHTALVLRSHEYDRVFSIESLDNGPELNILSTRIDRYPGKIWVCHLKPEHDRARHEIGREALGYVSTGYDWLGTAANLFDKVPPDDDRVFCSEFAYFAVYNARVINPIPQAPRPGNDLDELGVWQERIRIK